MKKQAFALLSVSVALAPLSSAQTSVSMGGSSGASISWPFIYNQHWNPTPFCQDPYMYLIGCPLENLEAVGSVKFSNASDSIGTRGMHILGEELTDKGSMTGALTQLSMDNYAGQAGSVATHLGSVSGWYSAGSVLGISASATPESLDNYSSTSISRGLGGVFSGGPSATGSLSLDAGVGTYWVGGSMGRLVGELNQTPADGALAAVIGCDESTGSATTYAGFFKGDVQVTGDLVALSLTESSSQRWKEDVREIESPANDPGRPCAGVRYVWSATGEEQIGFIAEEVAETLPEIVSFEADGKTARGVNYSRVTALLVEAVKDQAEEIEALRSDRDNEVNALRAELESRRAPSSRRSPAKRTKSRKGVGACAPRGCLRMELV